MSGLVYSASLIAAFLGGVLALFAPCCIVTLLPAFVGASIRRGVRTLPMTALLFSAGLAVVLLPIVLGIGALGRAIGQNHEVVFVVVGVFLLLLGAYILTGKRWSLPMPMMSGIGRNADGGTSTFFLGVASGVASSCCAPVVAGVVAMSALTRSWVGALGLGLAYILGMIFPLLLFALAAARRGERRTQAPPRRVTFLGTELLLSDAISGGTFVVFGGLMTALGLSGQESLTPGPLAVWDRWLTGVFADLASILGKLPVVLQASLLLGLATAIALPLYRAVRRGRDEPPGPTGDPGDDRLPAGAERDPVCGMLVIVRPDSLSADRDGDTYHFCANSCRDRFLAEPDLYASAARVEAPNDTRSGVRAGSIPSPDGSASTERGPLVDHDHGRGWS